VLSGGDDYELAFAVAPDREAAVAALAERLALPLTRVGALSEGQGVTVADAEGRPIPLEKAGWSHF